MTVFRRKIFDEMLAWKQNMAGEYALLVEGPRRVGKTTAVKAFAEREYDTYILVDFSEPLKAVRNVFKDDYPGLDGLYRVLQQVYGMTLYERRSVIIFDEVQLMPEARQLVKHIVADGRYDLIETGSLLSIKQNVEGILIPSEEHRIRMHPMDFEEFLWAQGNETTVPLLREAFESRRPLGAAHPYVLGLYRDYMLVGGMPQAVKAFLNTNSFEAAERAKEEVLALYIDDTVKIKRGGTKARTLLTRIPSFLSKHEKSFRPGTIKKGSRTRDYFDAVTWLEESRTVSVCRRCTDPGPALDLSIDELCFKLYMADTGLLITSAFSSNGGKLSDLYERMLRGKLNVNRGMLLENIVAQELSASGHKLAFAKFKVQGVNNYQEVDFLLADGRRVIPVEVKSAASTSHKSLDRFMSKYLPKGGQAYVIHTKDLRVDGDIVYLPVYMTMFL